MRGRQVKALRRRFIKQFDSSQRSNYAWRKYKGIFLAFSDKMKHVSTRDYLLPRSGRTQLIFPGRGK